ncbi:MAG: hypothetical protein ACRDR6_03200 [Pseudonocardiaceae bacterium]
MDSAVVRRPAAVQSSRPTWPVTIYLSNESVHEQVEAAVEGLLGAVGGHIELRDDPAFGSWFSRMWARTDPAVQAAARDAPATAAHALEALTVHAQDATITAKMLENLGPVLTALQPTEDAVVRTGALLIVKRNWKVVVLQLTPAQQLKLAHEPQLAQSPHDILSALTDSSTQSAEVVDNTRESTTERPSHDGLGREQKSDIIRRPNDALGSAEWF